MARRAWRPELALARMLWEGAPDPGARPSIMPREQLYASMLMMHRAGELLRRTAAGGGDVLFVSTMSVDAQAVTGAARRAGMPSVTGAWVGGLLTNWVTIGPRLTRLAELEQHRRRNDFGDLSEHERDAARALLVKLRTTLRGVRALRRLPEVVVIARPDHDQLALREARSLGLPVIAPLAPGAELDGVDHPVWVPDCDTWIPDLLRWFAGLVAESRGARRLARPSHRRQADEADERAQQPLVYWSCHQHDMDTAAKLAGSLENCVSAWPHYDATPEHLLRSKIVDTVGRADAYVVVVGSWPASAMERFQWETVLRCAWDEQEKPLIAVVADEQATIPGFLRDRPTLRLATELDWKSSRMPSALGRLVRGTDLPVLETTSCQLSIPTSLDVFTRAMRAASPSPQELREARTLLESRLENAAAWHTIGLIDMELGDYRSAVDRLTRFVDASERVGDVTVRISALNALGHCQTHLGRWPSAAATLRRALELTASARLDDEPATAPLLTQLAYVQLRCGELTAAAETLDRALLINRIYFDWGPISRLADSLARAQAAASAGDTRSAEAALLEVTAKLTAGMGADAACSSDVEPDR